MAQYSTNSDFSTDAAATESTADSVDGNEANITNFTVAPLHASGDLQTWTITTGGDEGGKYCAYRDTGGTIRIHGMSYDSLTIAGTDEFDVLMRFRAASVTNASNLDGIGYFLFDSGTSKGYALRLFANGNVRLYYCQSANWWTAVGAAVSLSLSADTWYWVRVHRMGSGDSSKWSWKLWSGDYSTEPAYSNGTNGIGDGGTGTGATTDTSLAAGTVAIAPFYYNTDPDYDWLSIGTGADLAPGPAGSGSSTLNTLTLLGVG